MAPVPFIRHQDWAAAAQRGLVAHDDSYGEQCARLDQLSVAGDGALLVGLVAARLFDRFAGERGGEIEDLLYDYLQRAAPLALFRPGCATILEVQFAAMLALEQALRVVGLTAAPESAERAARPLLDKVVRRAVTAPVKVSARGVPGLDDVDLSVDLLHTTQTAATIDALRVLIVLSRVAGGELLADSSDIWDAM